MLFFYTNNSIICNNCSKLQSIDILCIPSARRFSIIDIDFEKVIFFKFFVCIINLSLYCCHSLCFFIFFFILFNLYTTHVILIYYVAKFVIFRFFIIYILLRAFRNDIIPEIADFYAFMQNLNSVEKSLRMYLQYEK